MSKTIEVQASGCAALICSTAVMIVAIIAIYFAPTKPQPDNTYHTTLQPEGAKNFRQLGNGWATFDLDTDIGTGMKTRTFLYKTTGNYNAQTITELSK